MLTDETPHPILWNPCMDSLPRASLETSLKVQGDIVITLISVGIGMNITLLSFTTKFFYVMGKLLLGELSYMLTGLVEYRMRKEVKRIYDRLEKTLQ